MAAPETDVPNLLGEKSTPAKLEELTREVRDTFINVKYIAALYHDRF